MTNILRVFILVFPFITSCNNKKETISPQQKNITESVYASGIVKSKNQYEVYSKVNGVIKTFFVKEGDTVKAGSPLFEIDNKSITFSADNARLAAANASYTANLDKVRDAANAVENAQKKLANDSLLYIRQKNLWEKNIGTKTELEQRELSYLNSRSAHTAATSRLSDTQKQLKLTSDQARNNYGINQSLRSDLIVRSIVDGIIYKINKEEGEFATSQMPVAVVGASTDFIVELNIDEKDVMKVKPGLAAFIRLDSYRSQVFEGTLINIDPMMDERTRTFKAEAIFISQPSLLFPNLTVESNIVVQSKQNALTIPRNYLVADTAVMMENGNLKKIRIGLMDYNLAEVTEGLTSNDKIVMPE